MSTIFGEVAAALEDVEEMFLSGAVKNFRFKCDAGTFSIDLETAHEGWAPNVWRCDTFRRHKMVEFLEARVGKSKRYMEALERMGEIIAKVNRIGAHLVGVELKTYSEKNNVEDGPVLDIEVHADESKIFSREIDLFDESSLIRASKIVEGVRKWNASKKTVTLEEWSKGKR